MFWLAFLAATSGSMLLIGAYGREAFWPGLITNFAATLAAFVLVLVLALEFESERDARRTEGERARLRADQAEAQHKLGERLTSEARRRFEPVREELRRNRDSLELLSGAFAKPQGLVFNVLHPELLEVAWQANAPRLTELIADYELTSSLAASYGRIEELRWRLRHRTAQVTTSLDGMTKPLVDELLGEVTNLLERVGEQIHRPDVQELGLVHKDSGMVTVRLTGSAS
jgi:hypothetical protein